MNPVSITLVAIFATSLFSLVYVYKLRGRVRFASLSEYMRKGWPIFAPFNCFLYLFTKPKAKKAIMKSTAFEELKVLEDNWETIREEAVALYEKGFFDKTKDPNNAAFFDVGFRTFYKYGWGKFYLKWYGAKYPSAQKHCPKTTQLVSQIPSVNGAMFSVLPPGSKLTRHLDPVASSLRYHLGLSTPESSDCFINIDGESCSWKDGDGFLFDETYLHYAQNNTDKVRIILMCDVERPMFVIGQFINFIYKILMRLSVVPNTSGDPRGFANRVFAFVSPALAKSKELKKTNKKLYLLIKYSVNTLLIGILVGLVLLVVYLVGLTFE